MSGYGHGMLAVSHLSRADSLLTKIIPPLSNPHLHRQAGRREGALALSHCVVEIGCGPGSHTWVLPLQQAQLISMGTQLIANGRDLLCPLARSMGVASNQCIGASTSCVNFGERLNYELKSCKSDEVRPIDYIVSPSL
ncbi:hypothetical protein B0J13DRAFT_189668 [Dactylonectria estremocensis]|uniref:Uncharacterized protein n=1 Tax=Dactylonectria estremocensis TaxID=1079267 RepID=A0A9P9FCQ1_9HYPO|nr:hypothetical protein B0J13DRAFT_189668 [Dactylonectria estremocensis]